MYVIYMPILLIRGKVVVMQIYWYTLKYVDSTNNVSYSKTTEWQPKSFLIIRNVCTWKFHAVTENDSV